jgi:hypothetical protein
MRIRFFALCLCLCGGGGSLWADSPAASTANFTLSSPSRIPGSTLEPGSYSIHVVNRLSDRVILTVDGADGGARATFLGIPNSRIERPSSSGPVRWANPVEGVEYLKGWYFPGFASVVEFVYPKAEAVAIATANPAKVPAIDPASEGKASDNTLSKNDMQLLTLWLLSFQQVGPENSASGNSSGIKAERYQQTASVARKPVVAALPHTASRMPLLWLATLCALCAAVLLRVLEMRRRRFLLVPPQLHRE